MLAYLLYFQFAFLYLLVMLVGLVVYGSDFKGIAGWIYVIPLIGLTIIHKWVWSRRYQLESSGAIKIVSGVGAAIALLTYTPMHMGYWDEHSLRQALLIAGLGICSYLVSIAAASHVAQQPLESKIKPVAALALIGVFWMLARQYPLVIILCLAVLFVIAAFWLAPLPSVDSAKASLRTRSDPFAKYAVLLTAIDLGCVVWDFEVDTQWAWYVAAGFVAAAVGYYVSYSDKRSDRLEQTVYIAVILNFALAALWSSYILWFMHVIVAGFCLGYLLPAAMFRKTDQLHVLPTMGWTVWFFLGVALSNAWYANLLWAYTRIILLLPFVLMAVLYLRYRYSVLKHHA